MKKNIMTVVLAFSAILLQAQEVMKVELNEGKTIEYKVEDVKRVYFDTQSGEGGDDITTTSAILFVGEKKTIEGTVKTSSSFDDFVASVNGNVITANHAGATAVVVNEKHVIVVMVFSSNNLIDDPYLKWGEPKDSVKAHQKEGTLYSEDEKILIYKNCGGSTNIGYSFGDNGGLELVMVIIPTSKVLSFTRYLQDRFFIYPEKQSEGYYIGLDAYETKKAKTIIYYSPTSSPAECIYYPASKLDLDAARRAQSRIIQQMNLEE